MNQGALTERNDFKYDEQVYAAYLNIAKKFSEKWNAQAGVRGEYTVQDGDWMMTSAENTRSHRDYFDFFPSIFLSYAPSQKAVLSASWSYRNMENDGKMIYKIDQRQCQSGVTVGFTWRFGSNGHQQRRNVGTLEEESRL